MQTASNITYVGNVSSGRRSASTQNRAGDDRIGRDDISDQSWFRDAHQ